ncbi:MAG: tetratricopeptide repeat protein [Caulobacteraceae bacterium]
MDGIWGYLRLLWRHRIVQVAVGYVAVAWILFQGVAAIKQTWNLPNWVDQAAMVILVVGLAPTLIAAWTLRSIAPPAAPDQAPAPAPPRPLTAKPGISVAVLPFTNLSKEEEDEIFADGLVEDLITDLSLSSTLQVIARSSTFAYKGASPNVQEVAADLGARFVLEGSVRRVADRLRVTAQLIDAESGGHVWAEKYDRPVEELFELEDDLAREIAAAMGDAVGHAESARAKRKTTSLTAWEEAMRALISVERPTGAWRDAAVEHGRKAVKLDPQFALGHARLALALATRAQLTGGPKAAEDAAEAHKVITQALRLAPDDPVVLATACSALAHTGLPEEAVRHGMRSIAINPNNATVYGSVANALYRAGRYADAIPYYEEEERLAPRSPNLAARYLFRGLDYMMLRDLEKAVAAFERSIEMGPSFEGAWLSLGIAEQMRGDVKAAGRAIRRLRELAPPMTLPFWNGIIAANVPAEAVPARQTALAAAWAASEVEPLTATPLAP